jgi:hypothetical protein
MDGTTAWADAHIAVGPDFRFGLLRRSGFLDVAFMEAVRAGGTPAVRTWWTFAVRAFDFWWIGVRGRKEPAETPAVRFKGRLGLGFFLRLWRGLRLGLLRRG